MEQQKWWRRWLSRTAQIEVTVETQTTRVTSHSELASREEPDPVPERGTPISTIAGDLIEAQPADSSEVIFDRDK